MNALGDGDGVHSCCGRVLEGEVERVVGDGERNIGCRGGFSKGDLGVFWGGR